MKTPKPLFRLSPTRKTVRLRLDDLEIRVVPANETFTATQATVLQVDADNDGVVDPGETVTTTVTITNNSTNTAATGVQFAETLNGMTLVNQAGNDINVSPIAFDDTFTAVANTELRVGLGAGSNPARSVAGDVFDNDVEFFGDGFTLSKVGATDYTGTPVTISTTQGGSVTFNGDGTFSYTPQAGDAGVADTFTYTITDDGLDNVAGTADDLTGVGTVTINVGAQKVWYVDNARGTNGAGTSTDPFNTLTNVNGAGGAGDADAAGDILYLSAGSGAYAGGLGMEASQSLIGSGVALVVGPDTMSAAGTAPVLVNAGGDDLTLASGNTIRGLTVGTAADTTGVAVSGSSFGALAIGTTVVNTGGAGLSLTTGTISGGFTSITSRGGVNGVSLTGVAGNVSLNGGTGAGISGATGAAIAVSGGSVSFTLNPGVSQANNAPLLSVSGGHTGTLTFQSFGVSATNGTGLQFDNADGTYTFNVGTTLNGGDAGIDITNGSAGTFTFPSSLSISNPSGVAYREDASSANVTFNGSITKTNNATTAVDINGKTGGTTTFAGAITASTTTATAIDLTNNTGATVNFTGGGLDIDTTSGTGFNATGGGTLTVQGAGNSITSGTGTALNVANTTIGSAHLTFESISASGGTSGIILNSTGTVGGLHVTGTGAASSGGTIQNTSGVGVSLANTADVSLNKMTIANTGSHGVSGTGVTNVGNSGTVNNSFSFTNGLLNSPGDADNESALFFDALGVTNITGRLTVSGSTIQNFEDVGVHVGNVSGGLVVDVTDVIFNTNSATNGEEGIDVDASGTANITLNVSGTPTGLPSSAGFESTTRFINIEGGAINAVSQGSGVLDLNITSVDITTGTPGGTDNFPTPPALTFSAEGSASTFKFDIINNRIDDSSGDGIFIGHEGTMEGRITGNTITNIALGDGIRIDTDTTSNTTSTILIQNNIITGVGDDGIQILHRDGTKTLNLTINNNTITNTASEGIRYFADDDVAGGGPLNRLQITNNTFGSNGTADTADSIIIISQDPGTDVNTEITGNAGVEGITLQQSLSAALSIEQASTAALGAANGGAVVTATGTITFNTPVTVPQPTNPIMFAEGDVETAAPADSTPLLGADAPAPQPPVTPAMPPGIVPAVIVQMPVVEDDGVLSQAELDALVAAAITRWEATGLTAEQVSLMRSVKFTIEDLPGWYLGSAGDGTVTLDANAAGNKWFVDATPLDDGEFAGAGTRLTATADGGAAGRIDALTTVLHELGHQLGLDDTYSAAATADLMYGWLHLSERRLPGAGQADGAVPDHDHAGLDFIGAPVAIGTLPFGKSVQIQWQATINPQSNKLITNPVNSGTVSATNAPTAFPDVTTAPVTTTLDTLVFGGSIWNDNGAGGGIARNGIREAGEPKIGVVAYTLFADTGSIPGVWDAADTQIGSGFTGGGGDYAISVAPGEYIIRIDQNNFGPGGALELLKKSSPGNPDPDNNIDHDDNGDQTVAGQPIYSAPITLAYDTETTADGTGKLDINSTLDFGVFSSAPVVTATGGTTAASEQVPVAVDAGVTVADPDDATLASATVDFTAGFQSGQDVLAFTNDNAATFGDIGGGYAAGTGVLTLTSAGASTLLQWQNALRAVTYTNSSDTPNTANRTVQFVANDGVLNSAAVTKVVSVAAVNDGPAATITPTSYSATEQISLILKGAGLSVADLDAGSNSVTVTLSVTEGVLTSTAGDSGAGVAGNSSSTLTLTGTILQINALLGAGGTSTLNYINNSDAPSATATLTLTINDNGHTGTGSPPPASDTATINVAAVNDAPTATASGGGAAYTEGGAPAPADPNFLAADADGDGLNQAVVTVSDFVAGDRLNFTDTATITGVYAGGVLTLSGVDTAAAYQAAIRTVTFDSTSDDPTAGGTDNTRLLNFQVRDVNGAASSPVAARQVLLTAVNDGPTATITPLAYDATPAVSFDLKSNGLSVSDPDSAGGSVTVTLAVGEGTLTVTAGGSVAGVAGSGTASVTITGTAAQINALFNTDATSTVSYVNNVAAPATSTPLTLTINDNGNTGTGGALSDDDTATINLNSPPTGTTSGGVATYTEGGAAATVDPGFTAFDAEGDDLNQAVITVSDFRAGDQLNFTDTAAITGSYAGGVLTLSGVASVADYQAAIRTVTFSSTSDDPTAAGTDDTRSVSFQLRDEYNGVTPAPLPQRGIQVFGVNDGPTAVDDDADITEDAVPDTVSGNVLTNDTDPDDGTPPAVTVAEVNGLPAAVGQTVAGDFGDLVINSDGTYTYKLNNASTAVQALGVGETLTDEFTYTVTDTPGLTDEGVLTVIVHGANDDPVATDDSYTTDEDTAATGNVITDAPADSDPDATDTLTVTHVNGNVANVGTQITLVSGALLTVNANGTFTYDPTDSSLFNALPVGSSASDAFTYTVGDGHGGADTATVTLTVDGRNDAPTATGDTADVTEDTALTATGDVLSNDTDPDTGETATLAVTSVGTFSTAYGDIAVAADGTYTYTLDNTNPAVQALPVGQTLTDTFPYTIEDAQGAPATADLVVTIAGNNDAPAAVADAAAIFEDAAPNTVGGGVLTNDTDPDTGETATLAVVTAGTFSLNYGTLVLNSNGSYTYTLDNTNPAVQALAVGQTLADPFTYTVTDSHEATATATLTITIRGANDGPVATDNAYSLNEDAMAGGNVVTDMPADSDGDAGETATLTVSAVNGVPGNVGSEVTIASGAKVTVSATGAFTYVPATNFNGPDSFTYTVKDAQGAEDSATVTLTVNAAADTPGVTDATTTVNTQTTSGLVVSRNPGDGAEVTHFQVTNLTNGLLFLGDGTPVPNDSFVSFADVGTGLRFTPATNKANPGTTFGFDVRASVSASVAGLGGAVAHATVTVEDATEPTTTITAMPAAFTNLTAATFNFTGTDNVDPAVLTFEYRLDSAGAFTPTAAGAVSFSGLAQGSHTFEVRAKDAFGNVDSSPASYTWVVDTQAPTIAIGAPSRLVANSAALVAYTVTYTEPNPLTFSLDADDINLITAGGATATVASVVQDGTDPKTWVVTLTNIAANAGTVAFSIDAGTAVDAAGNAAPASATSATVKPDNTNPLVTIGAPKTVTGVTITAPTKLTTVRFAVTAADANPATFALAAGDVTFVNTGGAVLAADIAVAAGPGANTFTVTVSNIRGGTGKFRIQLPAGLAVDAAGNPSPAPAQSAEVSIIGVRKLVVGIALPPANFKRGQAYTYKVTYSNAGTQQMDGVSVVASLPQGATFNPAMSAAGWTAIGGGKFRITVGAVPAKGKGTFAFAVTLPSVPPKNGLAQVTAWIYDSVSGEKALGIRTVTSRYGRYA